MGQAAAVLSAPSPTKAALLLPNLEAVLTPCPVRQTQQPAINKKGVGRIHGRQRPFCAQSLPGPRPDESGRSRVAEFIPPFTRTTTQRTAIAYLQQLCSREMRRARVARLRLELNLGVIESPVRRHNASVGYESNVKTENWMALE